MKLTVEFIDEEYILTLDSKAVRLYLKTPFYIDVAPLIFPNLLFAVNDELILMWFYKHEYLKQKLSGYRVMSLEWELKGEVRPPILESLNNHKYRYIGEFTDAFNDLPVSSSPAYFEIIRRLGF